MRKRTTDEWVAHAIRHEDRINRALANAARLDEEERSSRRWFCRLGTTALVGIVLSGCLHVRAPVVEDMVAAVDTDGAPPSWASVEDGTSDTAAVRTMPLKPFKGQHRPPCPKDSTAINGGCWVEVKRAPGEDKCGGLSYHYDGGCYVPLKDVERPPTSVEE